MTRPTRPEPAQTKIEAALAAYRARLTATDYHTAAARVEELSDAALSPVLRARYAECLRSAAARPDCPHNANLLARRYLIDPEMMVGAVAT